MSSTSPLKVLLPIAALALLTNDACSKPSPSPCFTAQTPRPAARPKAPGGTPRFWQVAARLKDGAVDLQKVMKPVGVPVDPLCRGKAQLSVVSPLKDDLGEDRKKSAVPPLVALLRSSDETTGCSLLKVRSCALIQTGGAKPHPAVVALPLERLVESVDGNWVESRGGKLVLQVSSKGPSCDDPKDEHTRLQNATLAVLRYHAGKVQTLLDDRFGSMMTYGSNSRPTASLLSLWISLKKPPTKPGAPPRYPGREEEETGPMDVLVTIRVERMVSMGNTSWILQRRLYRLSADGKTLQRLTGAAEKKLLAHARLARVRDKKAMIALAEKRLD